MRIEVKGRGSAEGCVGVEYWVRWNTGLSFCLLYSGSSSSNNNLNNNHSDSTKTTTVVIVTNMYNHSCDIIWCWGSDKFPNGT